MTVEEIGTFALTVPGSDDYQTCDFRSGVIKSGTRLPQDRKVIYISFQLRKSQTTVISPTVGA